MTAHIISLAGYRATQVKPSGSSGSPIKRAKLVADRREYRRLGELRDDRRREPRYFVGGRCTPAIVLANGRVNLANVSRNGLMITTDLQAMPGTRILMTPIGCPPVSARLIWKRDGLAGFEAPLIAMELHFLESSGR